MDKISGILETTPTLLLCKQVDEINRLREEVLTYKRWWAQERDYCRKARDECFSLQNQLDEANLAGEELLNKLTTVEDAFSTMKAERDHWRQTYFKLLNSKEDIVKCSS